MEIGCFQARGRSLKKNKNAKFYDNEFSKIHEITIPPRPSNSKIVFHLYVIFAKKRDELLNFCKKKGIEAKVHYPKPMYLQESIKYLNYKFGDFPVTDSHTKKIITFPCDQHLKLSEMKYVVKCVKEFYKLQK